MKRRSLSRVMRTRIYDSSNGECCICGLYIHAERGDKWIVEHVKPLWLGGADDETNMRPAHQSCAVQKTSAEAPVKAKSDRVRAKHLGIRKPSRMPGSRDSKSKRTLDGRTVLRSEA